MLEKQRAQLTFWPNSSNRNRRGYQGDLNFETSFYNQKCDLRFHYRSIRLSVSHVPVLHLILHWNERSKFNNNELWNTMKLTECFLPFSSLQSQSNLIRTFKGSNISLLISLSLFVMDASCISDGRVVVSVAKPKGKRITKKEI